MLRLVLPFLVAQALAGDLTLDNAVPVRFGARFADEAGQRVAVFNGDKGVQIPIRLTEPAESEVVALVKARSGRKFTLKVQGQGVSLEAEATGTGEFQEVSLGRAKLSAGLGRLSVNASSGAGLTLRALRFPSASPESPPVWPLNTAYVDHDKGGAQGWRSLSLRDTGETRIPVSSSRDAEAAVAIAYRADKPARLLVDGRPFDLVSPGGSLRAKLAFRQGTQLVRIKAEGADVRIDGILLEGARVSDHWPLPNGNAQSVHFGYPVPEGVTAVWAYAEALAEPGPESTYHCVLGFGQGYFGYQVRYQRGRPDDRWFIYSLWDNGYVRNAEKSETKEELRDKVVTLVAKGPEVNASAFDHEGSGGHSHLNFRWKDREPYQFLLGVKPDGTGAIFSAWINGAEIGGWRFLTSFRRPNTQAKLDGLYSFVEDWSGRQGDQERACLYRNLWVADAAGKWQRLTRAKTSATAELGRRDFSHRVVGDAIELRTGGYRHADGKPGAPLEVPVSGRAPSVDFSKLPGGA
ncbi:MAG: DUF3472 domain-containing protein [Opitutia bacterium]|jgi:hypothetical protein